MDYVNVGNNILLEKLILLSVSSLTYIKYYAPLTWY